jgi:CO/xanthine dehydrogenase Mo-binding subunit
MPEASGPYGVKGIGEMGLVPTAPAITNAIYNALGVRVTAIPVAPEAIVAAP